MTSGRPQTRRLVLAIAASFLSRSARAQSATRRRVAYLSGGLRASSEVFAGVFREELRVLGYGDENIAMEVRYADGNPERLPDLAAELVQQAPEVIVAASAAAARAAKQATAMIPIVMAVSIDPVGAGLIASLARPGGNVTGLSVIQEDIVGKELELLKTAVPGADRIAVLVNPGNPSHAGVLRAAQQAALTLGTELVSVEVRASDDIDGAFATLMREHVNALVVLGDSVFVSERRRIADLALRHKLPAVSNVREFVAVGVLMSYGASLEDSYRRAATYVDKILKGAKPADLPVQQPTKFELVINLKTAHALGLTVPQSLLLRADEVIE